MIRLLLASTALALGCSSAAFATAADDEQVIIVTGYLDGYRAVSTTSGTKTDTPILDVPQSISVMTEKQLRELHIQLSPKAKKMLEDAAATSSDAA